MNEYINKYETLNTLCDNCDTVQAVCSHFPCKRYTSIEQLSCVDAVEIVRCKDCKYYGRVDERRFYRGSDCLNGHIDTIVPDRDFCSRGEWK